MYTIVIVVHVIVAIAIVGLVLLQQGKGADAGASFGAGASQTVFGSSGSGNFLVRATTVAATIFFVTSLSLAIFARNQSGITGTSSMPVVSDEVLQEAQQRAADDDVPSLSEIPETPDASGGDVPSLPGN